MIQTSGLTKEIRILPILSIFGSSQVQHLTPPIQMVSGTLSMMVLAVAIWLSVWQIKPLLKLRLKEMSKLQKLDSCVLSIISML
ncbi:Uncharacterised protein [Segatella copri]|nr:Uncharacterised protein [Segatella copri]